MNKSDCSKLREIIKDFSLADNLCATCGKEHTPACNVEECQLYMIAARVAGAEAKVDFLVEEIVKRYDRVYGPSEANIQRRKLHESLDKITINRFY